VIGDNNQYHLKCIGIYGVSGRNASSTSIQEKRFGSFPSFADCCVDDTTLAQKADNDVDGPQGSDKCGYIKVPIGRSQENDDKIRLIVSKRNLQDAWLFQN
jgi:hypothetical protein